MTVPRSVLLACLLLPLSWTAPAVAADPPSWRSAQQILDASPASDWRTPDPANLLYMELDAGRVVIELAPGFAPEHVANIRTLAGEGFWDGTSIYRVQDNFVAQFGDVDADDAAKARTHPPGTQQELPAEFTRDASGVAFDRLPDRCREVVWLRRVEDLSQKEVAVRLGISEKTVEKHIAKGMRLLADHLHGSDGVHEAKAAAADRRDGQQRAD